MVNGPGWALMSQFYRYHFGRVNVAALISKLSVNLQRHGTELGTHNLHLLLLEQMLLLTQSKLFSVYLNEDKVQSLLFTHYFGKGLMGYFFSP